MTTEPVAPSFNPFDPAFRRDPYPSYAWLREHAPVNNAGGFWTVAAYEDVVHVLKSPQLFSSKAMGGAMAQSQNGMGALQVRTIINTDPPEHTQIRNLVNRAFTPRMVADMEPRIREIARELLDHAIPSGELELVGDLATPLPVTVIAEILGVDPDRRDDFKRWSNAVVGGIGVSDGDVTARQQDREEFFGYFSEAIEQRRQKPSDDLISSVLKAEEQDVALTPDEIASFTMLLLIAGNETTTNLIGNAMLALTEHPDQLAAVSDDPSLIPNMVEEALRYDSPVQFLFRTTTAETEVGGTTIPAGNGVVPMYASANRDSARFPDADAFDISRNAQGHVAFGLGPHFCLGAPLARLEAKVAFEELFARAQRFQRQSDEVDRIDSLMLRGLRTLPLSVRP